MSINDIESFIYSPPPGAINDLRYENLRSEGYYGSLNDMLYQKFRQKALNLVLDRLFVNGEKGINKLDFSDFTGMYQDLARTVPYTAVEQPLGSFTGLNGVTATALADVNRGVVSARVNLLTKTEQFDDAVWQKLAATVIPNAVVAPDGTATADKLVEDTSASSHRVLGPSLLVSLTAYSFRVYLKAAERSFAYIRVNNVGGDLVAGTVDLLTGSVTSAIVGSLSIDAVGDGWYIVTGTGTSTVTTNTSVEVRVANAGTYVNYIGDGTSGIYVWGASLTLATDAHLPYQWVNTATDYDTVGFPYYLTFDGTSTAYVTPSIDFTSTDKMTVWAGITKLSDVNRGILAELSNGSTPGSFSVQAPSSVGGNDYLFLSRGSIQSFVVKAGYPSPYSSVLCGTSSISEPSISLRINGATVASSIADQGSGNYGNYPLYIGARTGTSVFFNGRLYGLIARGAATPLPQIEAVETLIHQKMRLP